MNYTEEKFYTCRYDRAFKEVMLNEKNKDLLKGLLENILKVKITQIEIKPNERNNGNLKIKRKTFDALLVTNEGEIGVEVNTNNEKYVYPRNMAYISDVYSDLTLVSEIYNEDTKIIQINLSYGLNDNEKIRVYYMQDNDGKKFVKNLQIYEVNMEYYRKIWYDNNKEEIKKINI